MVLDTLVYHIGEHTEAYPPVVHVPNVGAVYQQILAANGGKYPNVLLLPVYNGHLSGWSEEKAWIINNFAGIPIMLEVFASTGGEAAYQLTTEQIQEILDAGIDVKYVRIFEVMSYFTLPEFPSQEEYMIELLTFCKNNGIKVFWSEWSAWCLSDGIELIRGIIEGFEDIVTMGFGTNSEDLEPKEGFELLKRLGFEHWGGSVQAWYWDTRHNSTWSGYEYPSGLDYLLNMPVAWMVTHANECRDLGGQLIQFEPYWYFFGYTDGKARDSLKTLHYYLNSAMASMESSTIILQTLMGEWVNDPAKADIEWLEGRAETGWDMQPSAFDFMKMTKKYTVTCYNVGSLNPSQRLYLKVDVVAVEVLVKVLGTTLEKAALAREAMRVEVERIMHMYSVIGPPWRIGTGFLGAPRHRRIPGLKDVVISQTPSQTENASFARVTVQVKCRVFPKKTWVDVIVIKE